VQHSDPTIFLARNTPLAEVLEKSEGFSIFLVELSEAIGDGLMVQRIPNMAYHESNELFFDGFEIPAENLIGEEGKGFRYILDGLVAKQLLTVADCIADDYWLIDKVTKYVKERIVFGRPIGQNHGVQFPIEENPHDEVVDGGSVCLPPNNLEMALAPTQGDHYNKSPRDLMSFSTMLGVRKRLTFTEDA
jgi:hypothetical protein